jgi:predicted pyridoxine 5'-phosphate oxidase superfamily flavin-nucleotide-binding protein
MRGRQADGSVWHEGELAIQERAGQREAMSRAQAGIRSEIPERAGQFLQAQRFAVVGSLDRERRVWASLLTGPAGFLRVIDPSTLEIRPSPPADELLLSNLAANSDVGLLAIEFSRRRRMRLNGEARVQRDGSIAIRALQVYSNCPQYIQARGVEDGETEARSPGTTHVRSNLGEEQARMIRRADTFFIASAHPEYGVDASHRGGNPGFVQVISPGALLFPDYAGNNMFNTLGNLAINPRAGLLFVDFESGHTLQITGKASVDWDADRIRDFPGAQRLVDIAIEQVLEKDAGCNLKFHFESFSPVNPPLRGQADTPKFDA